MRHTKQVWWDVVVIDRKDLDGDRYEATTYTYATHEDAIKKCNEEEGCVGDVGHAHEAVLIFCRTRTIEVFYK